MRDIAGDLQPTTFREIGSRITEEEVGAHPCPTCDLTYDHESWCPERLRRFLLDTSERF